MGTRSTIARLNNDESIDSIYCHWDGYPLHNGQLLQKHYHGKRMLDRLIKLGDLSSLGEQIGFKHDFDFGSSFYDKEKKEHAAGNTDYSRETDPEYQALRLQCNAYTRDRGEKDCLAKHHDNPETFWEYCQESWCEWCYLNVDGVWYVSVIGGACGPFLVKRDDPDGEATPNWIPLADLSYDKRPGEKYEPDDGRYFEIRERNITLEELEERDQKAEEVTLDEAA